MVSEGGESDSGGPAQAEGNSAERCVRATLVFGWGSSSSDEEASKAISNREIPRERLNSKSTYLLNPLTTQPPEDLITSIVPPDWRIS